MEDEGNGGKRRGARKGSQEGAKHLPAQVTHSQMETAFLRDVSVRRTSLAGGQARGRHAACPQTRQPSCLLLPQDSQECPKTSKVAVRTVSPRVSPQARLAERHCTSPTGTTRRGRTSKGRGCWLRTEPKLTAGARPVGRGCSPGARSSPEEVAQQWGTRGFWHIAQFPSTQPAPCSGAFPVL